MSKFFIYFFYFSTLKWKKSIDENTRFKDNSFLPCVLVQNKIDLVNENVIKNDKSFIDFAKRNNFIKCFRTSVKKKINVDEVMDFLIEYIINKLEEVNMKNINKTNEKINKIILTTESLEGNRDINNDLQATNCCSDSIKLEKKNDNRNNRLSDNSNSTNGISDEEKKEID